MTNSLTRAELLAFMRRHRYAVEATAGGPGGLQAAVVGIAVADDFTVVFDTIETSRKAANLAADPKIALVIGGTANGDEETVQLEGVVERMRSSDVRVVEELYFRIFPEGRDRLSWEGIMHFRVRPSWLRYSDYRPGSSRIVELNAGELAQLR